MLVRSDSHQESRSEYPTADQQAAARFGSHVPGAQEDNCSKEKHRAHDHKDAIAFFQPSLQIGNLFQTRLVA